MTNIDCMETIPGAAVVPKGWDFICGIFDQTKKKTKTKNNKNKKARVPLAGQNTMLSFFFFFSFI